MGPAIADNENETFVKTRTVSTVSLDGGKKNLREPLISHCHEGTMGHFGGLNLGNGFRWIF
jgi:hypothetical protein